MLHRTYQKLGFTIVEIIVVVTLIGILITISFFAWNGIRDRSFNTNIINSMTAYKTAFDIYAQQEHVYPPVPGTGNYCLQTSAFTAAEVHALNPAVTLPSTILSAPAYYCREIDWTPQRHAGYPPLNTALSSVAQVNSAPENGKKQQIDSKSGGVFALYESTTTAPTVGDTTRPSRITIKGMLRGHNCPQGITQEWVSTEGTPRTICSLMLERTYPVTYTLETWNYYGDGS